MQTVDAVDDVCCASVVASEHRAAASALHQPNICIAKLAPNCYSFFMADDRRCPRPTPEGNARFTSPKERFVTSYYSFFKGTCITICVQYVQGCSQRKPVRVWIWWGFN